MRLQSVQRRSAALALLLLVLQAACSSDEPEPVTAPGSPSPAAAAPPATPAAGNDLLPQNLIEAGKFEPVEASPCRDRLQTSETAVGFRLFFACTASGGPPINAAAAPRPSSQGDSMESALRALFAGPTADETAAGYSSPFGAATSALPFTVARRDDIAVVNLSAQFDDVAFAGESVQETAEIVSTLGQFPGVRRVSILLDGEPACVRGEACRPEDVN